MMSIRGIQSGCGVRDPPTGAGGLEVIMEKTVKAQKMYFCDHCLRRIEKGESYIFGKIRGPVFLSATGAQVGIRYSQWRLCNRDDCNTYGANFDEDDLRGETRHLANMRGRR